MFVNVIVVSHKASLTCVRTVYSRPTISLKSKLLHFNFVKYMNVIFGHIFMRELVESLL